MGGGQLLRIGVFYDGNFFSHVSNYYYFTHPVHSRISISGLHDFIRREVSLREGVDKQLCRITEAHYFRGRLRAYEADQRDMLFKERTFEEVLTREGITTHYLPLAADGEKGIDVWLALEVLENAIQKKFDVVVLIAGDGDFLSLVRKLTSVGTRSMVLGWNLSFYDKDGNLRETRTSQALMDEVIYPVYMHNLIGEDTAREEDPFIRGLFVGVPSTPVKVGSGNGKFEVLTMDGETFLHGTIQNIKEGYGFITPDDGSPNLFFHSSDLRGTVLARLSIGDRVRYTLGENHNGPCATGVSQED
jgi:cold shock CspA family protein